jgi:hypothetical protein
VPGHILCTKKEFDNLLAGNAKLIRDYFGIEKEASWEVQLKATFPC